MRYSVNSVLPFLLLLPAGIIFAIFLIYPIFGTIHLSFCKIEDLTIRFVGFDNYWAMFNDPLFWNATWNTLLWLLIQVPGKLIAALGFAILLNEDFRGRKWVEVIVLMPFALPISIVAVIGKWLFAGTYGYINSVLIRIGLINEGIPFLAYPASAFAALNIISAWIGIPFYTLFFHSALKNIPEVLYEAAKIDGASTWRCFRYITLPQLKGIIVINAIIATLLSFNNFPIIWAMTGGGPIYGTDTLVTFLYRETFSFYRPEYGSAIATFSFLFLTFLSIVYIKLYFKR